MTYNITISGYTYNKYTYQDANSLFTRSSDLTITTPSGNSTGQYVIKDKIVPKSGLEESSAILYYTGLFMKKSSDSSERFYIGSYIYVPAEKTAPTITSVTMDQDTVNGWKNNCKITVAGGENYTKKVTVQLNDGNTVIYKGTATVFYP